MSGKKQCEVCGSFKKSDTMRLFIIDKHTNSYNPNRYTIHSICGLCDQVLSIRITDEMVQRFFCSNDKVNLWTEFPLNRDIEQNYEFMKKWEKYNQNQQGGQR